MRSNLSWSDHIAMVCSKARKLLGLLYRQFHNHATPSTIKQLYLSLVRPHLEYAAPLWDPYLQNDVDALEGVQKFAMKLITRKWDHAGLCTAYANGRLTILTASLIASKITAHVSYYSWSV